MTDKSFDKIWEKIKKYEGETFSTITGLKFTYEVHKKLFYPSRAKYQISKSDFLRAHKMFPLKGPGEISKMVRGASYVWSVLNDKRILHGEY